MAGRLELRPSVTAKRTESVSFRNQCSHCGNRYEGTVTVQGSDTDYIEGAHSPERARATAEAKAHDNVMKEARAVVRLVRCPSCGRHAPVSAWHLFWLSVLGLASFVAPILWFVDFAMIANRIKRGHTAANAAVRAAVETPSPLAGIASATVVDEVHAPLGEGTVPEPLAFLSLDTEHGTTAWSETSAFANAFYSVAPGLFVLLIVLLCISRTQGGR